MSPILGSWLLWSNWSEWSECIGGICRKIGKRIQTKRRVQCCRKNEFSKRYPHLVIVTRTTARTILDPYHLEVTTISTGTMFGREEVREQPGRCTLIGYFLYYLRD